MRTRCLLVTAALSVSTLSAIARGQATGTQTAYFSTRGVFVINDAMGVGRGVFYLDQSEFGLPRGTRAFDVPLKKETSGTDFFRGPFVSYVAEIKLGMATRKRHFKFFSRTRQLEVRNEGQRSVAIGSCYAVPCQATGLPSAGTSGLIPGGTLLPPGSTLLPPGSTTTPGTLLPP